MRLFSLPVQESEPKKHTCYRRKCPSFKVSHCSFYTQTSIHILLKFFQDPWIVSSCEEYFTLKIFNWMLCVLELLSATGYSKPAGTRKSGRSAAFHVRTQKGRRSYRKWMVMRSMSQIQAY